MNTLIIGTGYHARRIYLPFLKEKVQSLTNLVCGLDIVSQKKCYRGIPSGAWLSNEDVLH